MATKKRSNNISLLCLIIFLLLIALNVVRYFDWIPLQNWMILVAYALFFFLPTWIYVKRRGRKRKEILRMRRFPLRDLPAVLMISVALCVICALMNVVSALVFGTVNSGQTASMIDFVSENPLALWLAAVILPAFTEEVLLRGLALSEYESYGSWRAVVITSVIFAFFHGNPNQLLSLFTAGICYALLTLLFGSIYPALIAHLFNNTLALLVAYNQDYFSYILGDPLFLILLLIGIFLWLIVTLRLLESVIARHGKRGKLQYTRRRGASPWHNLFLWLFLLGCITKMILTYFL